MTAADWRFVAGVLSVFLFLALSLAAIALDCNLTLKRRAAAADASARKARAEARRDKAEAAQLRKSNEALRRHTAEHCRREAAIKALLASEGIVLVDSPADMPVMPTTDDLDAVETPADIEWGGRP